MDETQLLTILESFPPEGEREFELRATAVGVDPATDLQLLDTLARRGDEAGYAAFFSLVSGQRRKKDYRKMLHAVEWGARLYGDRPTFTHLVMLTYLEAGVPAGQEEQTLLSAYEDYQQFSTNAGHVHLFADMVATILESDEKMLERFRDRWLGEALLAASRAITLTPQYAKFYATQARLEALDGEYDVAMRLIDQAIDLEDSSRGDYALRIGNYQTQRVRIVFDRRAASLAEHSRQSADSLRNELSHLTTALTEARAELAHAHEETRRGAVRNIEFIGFFAGIVSFTIGSLQLAAGQNARDAALLILMLTGAMLIAFTGFSYLLEPPSRERRIPVIGAVGTLCIVLAGGALWLG